MISLPNIEQAKHRINQPPKRIVNDPEIHENTTFINLVIVVNGPHTPLPI